MRRNRGLTIVEVLMYLVLLAMVAVLLMPTLASHGRTSRVMQNNTQIRGIHQGLIVDAQNNSGYYTGLDVDGKPAGLAVEERFKALLDGDFFTPEYAVSPSETSPAIRVWQTGPFTSDHHSYAMLQVPVSGGRYEEWRETFNPAAIAVTDRNTGTASQPASIYTGATRGGGSGCSWRAGTYAGWAGGVAFNDNSVQFTEHHRDATDYAGHAHVDDHLFEAAGDDDAYLIHSGN
ncbi:MAG: type II secretion system protein [Phycisphaeraceae bacterium]